MMLDRCITKSFYISGVWYHSWPLGYGLMTDARWEVNVRNRRDWVEKPVGNIWSRVRGDTPVGGIGLNPLIVQYSISILTPCKPIHPSELSLLDRAISCAIVGPTAQEAW